MDFPFDEKPNVTVMTCRHVLDDGAPVLYASHDAEDGMWQFLCGEAHQVEDARIVGLREIYERDKSLAEIARLPLGCAAERTGIGGEWTRFEKG